MINLTIFFTTIMTIAAKTAYFDQWLSITPEQLNTIAQTLVKSIQANYTNYYY